MALSLTGEKFIYKVIVIKGASLVAQRLNCLPAMQETQVQSLGREDPLGQEDPWGRKWKPTPVFLPGESP